MAAILKLTYALYNLSYAIGGVHTSLKSRDKPQLYSIYIMYIARVITLLKAHHIFKIMRTSNVPLEIEFSFFMIYILPRTLFDEKSM